MIITTKMCTIYLTKLQVTKSKLKDDVIGAQNAKSHFLMSPDCNKAIYSLLGKIELAIFPGVFNTALSRVKISKTCL